MKKAMFLLLMSSFQLSSKAQTIQLEVEGAIQIGNTNTSSPVPGTIRFNGLNFEGWNGITWVPMSTFHIISVVTDPDGNVYHSIGIGEQEWMLDNLRTSKYADGTSISLVTDNNTWAGLSIVGAYCWYNNNNVFENPYGKLYNWFAVNSGKLCPTGWRVATDSDWTTLINYLGGSASAGGKMKEMAFNHWATPNTGATNTSNFSGLPGGLRYPDGSFSHLTLYGSWWSANEVNLNLASHFALDYDDANIDSAANSKQRGLSIRCIKN